MTNDPKGRPDEWRQRRDQLTEAEKAMRSLVRAAEQRDERSFASGWEALRALALDDVDAPAAQAMPAPAMPELVDAVTREIERTFNARGLLEGAQTGLRDLDCVLGALAPGQVIVLAGRPSTGRTALATQVACNVALRQKRPVFYATQPLTGQELVARMISGESKIPASSVKRAFIQRHQWSALAEAAGALSEAPMKVDGSCVDVTTLVARARHGESALIVVDQLESVLRGSSAHDALGALRQVAADMRAALILVAGLRPRDHGALRRPLVDDLSDEALEGADVVMLLDRPEHDLGEETPEHELGIARLIVAKNRSGPSGTVELHFRGDTLRFEDLKTPADEAVGAFRELASERDEEDEAAASAAALDKPPPDSDR